MVVIYNALGLGLRLGLVLGLKTYYQAILFSLELPPDEVDVPP